MRAASSVRVHTRLPHGARWLGPQERGGSDLRGSYSSFPWPGFSNVMTWGGRRWGGLDVTCHGSLCP